MKIHIPQYIYRFAAAALILPLLGACASLDEPEREGTSVPEGMVEIRPVLPGLFSSIPRVASDTRSHETRTYPDNTQTNTDLNGKTLHQLPNGSTVWLIADKQEGTGKDRFSLSSYVVYNPQDEQSMSYLVPCTVDENGKMKSMEGTPFYLKKGETYKFSAISPARKLDETMLADGKLGFQVKNGEYFYANDCRYHLTTPDYVEVQGTYPEDIQVIKLKPMINQTAQLKFQIRGKEGGGVHDLDIQPSGIQISGLQNDSPAEKITKDDGTEIDNPYGNSKGLYWHMSEGKVMIDGKEKDDEPITLQHGNKTGSLNRYDYTIDPDESVNIEVPILPMRSVSKPVIVIFRLKINGVPTSYEMMLNEKDFKAGYSYGYRGSISIEDGVSVITWQYVSWEHDVELDINKTTTE